VEGMGKAMKKTVKIIIGIFACIVCLLLIIIGGFNAYLRIAYYDFYKSSETCGNVPGVSDGFIQQGLSYVPEAEKFVSCGYMKDGSASRIYIFDAASEDFVTLHNADGTPNSCHAGGLSYWNGYILMCDDDGMSVYNINDVMQGGGVSVFPISSFNLDFDPAFCCIDGNTLYIGEFYRDPNYLTDSSHHITTPSGDEHHALTVAYDMNDIAADGFVSAVPLKAYSTVDLAQGMCITGSGRICISTSYAVAGSHIYVYDEPDDKSDSQIKIGETTVPLYYLDSSSLDEDISLFPMSEELVAVDGKVYIINESASAKYIFGRLTGGGKIYSLDIK
jgi:hypothetical protein